MHPPGREAEISDTADRTPRTIFGHLARFVLRHSKPVAVVVAVLTVFSVGLASRLQVDSNVLTLMPEDNPVIQSLNELDAQEGGVTLMTVAVSGEPEATAAMLTELAEVLEASERVDYALWTIDDELAWRLGVVNLEAGELEEIRDRLKGALALGPQIANPFIAGRLLALGPLTQQLQEADARHALTSPSPDGETAGMARLLIRPTVTSRDILFARALVAELDEAVAQVSARHPEVAVEWVGGAYANNVQDYEDVQHDVRWTGLGSLVLVLILLTAALRDPRVLVQLFVPLMVGASWSFGFASVAIGSLNTFTAGLGAILFGLGIDFAIHLYTRYRELRNDAPDLETAVVRAWDKTGPPCAAAGLTSAGGFSALLLADFDGFSQLGGLLAFGVLACLTSVLVVLPLMIRWREKRVRRWHQRQIPVVTRRPPTYRLAPVGFLALILVTVVGAFLMRGLEFEYDMSTLRASGLAWGELDERERELAVSAMAPTIVTFSSAEDMAQGHAALTQALRDGELPYYSRVVSVKSLIPDNQDAKLAILGEIRELGRDDNYALLPEPVRANLQVLEQVSLQPLGLEDLPSSLRHLVGAGGGHHRVMLFPNTNVWDMRISQEMKAHVQAVVGPNNPVAGDFLALGAVADVVLADAPWVALGAFLLVCLGTLVDLKRPLRAAGAILLLLMGMVWAGGAVATAGIRMSIVNFVGIPILLGIGVDVVIHLLHRLAEEGPGKVLKALATTGWASGLSAATTVLSFASLALAENRGIRSLGMLVLVGLTTVTIAAFFLVPLGWMSVWKIAGDAPADLQDDDEE